MTVGKSRHISLERRFVTNLTGVGYDVGTRDGSNVGTRGGSDVSTRCGSDFGADGGPDVDAHGGAATQMASYPLFLFRDLLFFYF